MTGSYRLSNDGIYCSACQSYSGIPTTHDWWWFHSSLKHQVIEWVKRHARTIKGFGKGKEPTSK